MNRSVLFLLFISACCKADDLPLLASDASLEIVFEFPLEIILKQAADRPVVDGFLYYINAAGEQVTIPTKMTTRGKSRLELCRFPPLSLRVGKKAAMGTIFEGQKKLKIVTHCRADHRFRNYLLQEYSIYEAFSVLTDISFRTRYLNVTYRDSNPPHRSISEPAFFIESINHVADRTQLETQKVGEVRSSQLDPGFAAY